MLVYGSGFDYCHIHMVKISAADPFSHIAYGQVQILDLSFVDSFTQILVGLVWHTAAYSTGTGQDTVKFISCRCPGIDSQVKPFSSLCPGGQFFCHFLCISCNSKSADTDSHVRLDDAGCLFCRAHFPKHLWIADSFLKFVADNHLTSTFRFFI